MFILYCSIPAPINQYRVIRNGFIMATIDTQYGYVVGSSVGISGGYHTAISCSYHTRILKSYYTGILRSYHAVTFKELSQGL